MMMVVVVMTALVVESPEGPFDPATRFPACSSPLNNQYSAHALILYTANTFCVSQYSALNTSNTFCGKVPINTLSYCTLLILFGPANTLYCTLSIFFCGIIATNTLQLYPFNTLQKTNPDLSVLFIPVCAFVPMNTLQTVLPCSQIVLCSFCLL